MSKPSGIKVECVGCRDTTITVSQNQPFCLLCGSPMIAVSARFDKAKYNKTLSGLMGIDEDGHKLEEGEE